MSDEDPSTPQVERPTSAVILTRWSAFHADPLLSMAHIKGEAISGEIPTRGLRSLYWRHFFSLLPSPAAPSSSSSSTYALSLGHSRSEYSDLREKLLRSPDGGWVNDGSSGRPRPDGPKGAARPVAVQVNNPLGLDTDNPWSAWFEDLELRRTIRQDVQRTFPEIDYFRDSAVQDKTVDLLFIWSKLTPEIGYRQGMHELLGSILWTVDYDSLLSSVDTTDSLAHLVLSREHIEHDTWQLYSSLMKSAKIFYDSTPSVPLPVNKSLASASTTSLTLSNSTSQSASTVLVQPIVGTAIRIHDSLLKTIDHDLWSKMEQLGVEPQIWGIRWLRLLFSREFPIDEALMMWDGLFAEDTSMRLMEYICVAMLLRIRDALLDADYSEFLQLLLRYPALSDGTHRIPLLLQQAIYLRDNVSAEAGERCRAQNVSVGAIVGGNLVRGQDTERRSRAGHRKAPSTAGFLGEGGLVGDIAKGVYGRAEALGVFSAFNEIKRGVAEAQAQAQARAQAQAQAQRGGMSEIPSRMPWDSRPPPAGKDYLAEIGKMRQTSLAMSNAIDLCVNVLQQEVVVGKPGPEETPPPTGETIMALTALCHIRDVLAGKARTFDASVLSPLTSALENGVLPDRPPSTSPSPAPSPAPVPSPSPAAAPPAPSAEVPPPTPSLYLSSRNDKPLPSLTRTPLGPTLQAPQPPPRTSPPSASGRRQLPAASFSETNVGLDPLGVARS